MPPNMPYGHSGPEIWSTELNDAPVSITPATNWQYHSTDPSLALIPANSLAESPNSIQAGIQWNYGDTGALASFFGFATNTDSNLTLRNKLAGELQFFTSDTQRVTVAAGGNVGINQPTPTSLLHVEGTMDVQGHAQLDQVSIVTDDGQFQVSGSNAVDIDVAAASRFVTSAGNITIDAEDGNLVLDGNGAVDIDSTGVISIDTTATGTGITIGTATSGLNITIGNANSNVTIGDDLIVTDRGSFAGNAIEIDSYATGANALGTAIAGLVSGSVNGGLIQGQGSGHAVVQLRTNDAHDSFAIVANTTATDTDVPDTLAFQVKRDGSFSFGGGGTFGGGIIVEDNDAKFTILDSSTTVTNGDTMGALCWRTSDNSPALSSDILGQIEMLAAADYDLGAFPESKMTFSTSDGAAAHQVRMTIDKNGNVGIGTTTPSTQLDVASTFNVDGAATLDQVTIDTTDGQFAVSGSNAIDFDVAAASRFVTSAGDLTLDSEAGTLVLNGNTGVDIDSTGLISLETTDTSNGISIGCDNSGVPIFIGHTTSEVTIRDNLTVTGDLNVVGTTTTVNSTTLNIADNLITVNAGPSGTADGGMLIKRYQTINDAGAGGDVVLDAAAVTGTAQAGGTATTITLHAGASGVDDFYNGMWINITGGTASGNVRRIKDYDGTTKVATIYDAADQAANDALPAEDQTTPAFGADFTASPDATSTFTIHDCPFATTFYDESVDKFVFACTSSDPGTAPVAINRYLPICVGTVEAENITMASNDPCLIIRDTTAAAENDTIAEICFWQESTKQVGTLGFSSASDGNFDIRNSTATGQIDFFTNDTFVATIDTDGDLGLGVASPADPIHVNRSDPHIRLQDSNAATSTDLTAWTSYYSDAGRAGLVGFDSNSTGHLSIRNETTTGAVRMLTNTIERMRITSDGDVGIGATLPSKKFHVVGDGLFTSTLDVNGDFAVGASLDSFYVEESTNFVGIGTASPSVSLHIGTDDPNIRLHDTNAADATALASIVDFHSNAGSAGYLGFEAASPNFVWKNQDAAGELRMETAGGVGITVEDVNASVGIRQTAPTAALHVGDSALSGGVKDGISFLVDGMTYDDNTTAASGTATHQYFNELAIPTLTATNASVTTTTACTLNIAGAPVAGTNQTITNAYALCIEGGNSIFNGDVTVTGNLNVPGINITGTDDCDGAGGGALSTAGGLDVAKSACILEDLNVGTAGSELFKIDQSAGTMKLDTTVSGCAFEIENTNTPQLCVSLDKAAVSAADELGRYQWRSNDTNIGANNLIGEIKLVAQNSFTGTHGDTRMDFVTSSNGTGSATKMSLTKDGNLGIGITAPTHKLSVVGTANITGAVTMGSTLDVTDTISANKASGNGLDVTADACIGGQLIVDDIVEKTAQHGVCLEGALFRDWRQTTDDPDGIHDLITAANGGFVSIEGIEIKSKPSQAGHIVFYIDGNGPDDDMFAIIVKDSTNAVPEKVTFFSQYGQSTFQNSLRLNGDRSEAPSTSIGQMLNVVGSTVTDNTTAASGTAAGMHFSVFAAPTLAATNASVTTTTACTVKIAGAPIAGTNQTITNAYALCVDSGNSTFGGDVSITGTLSVPGINITGTDDCNGAQGGAISTLGGIDVAKSICVLEDVKVGTAGSETFFVDSSASAVAIGHNAPATALDIRTTAPTVRIQDSSATGSAATSVIDYRDQTDSILGIVGYNSASNNTLSIRNETSDGTIDFMTDSTTRMRVLESGNVFIGGTGTGTSLLRILSSSRTGAPTADGSTFQTGGAWEDDTTSASGTAASHNFNVMNAPTLSATNASVTTTTACTFAISGAPIAGTNQTITTPYAFCIESGNATMAGDLNVDGALTTGTLTVSGTADCTDKDSGAFVIEGGMGVEKSICIGLNLDVDGLTTLDQTTINTTDGQFAVSGTNAVDIDVAAASRFVTSAGNITVDAEAGTLVLDGHTGIDADSTGPISIDTTNTGTGVTIATGTSGVPVSIGNATSEVTVNDNFNVSGDSTLTGFLDVDGLTTLDQTTINTTDGAFLVEGSGAFNTTNTGAISMSGNSGIDIDSTGAISMDTTNTVTGITIGTVTSGVPVTIGHTTSEVTVADNLTVTGDLTVNGAIVDFNIDQITVDDPNITIGAANTTDPQADGGGITLVGATNKTITWVDSTDCWTFNQCIDAQVGITITDTTDCDGAAGGSLNTAGGLDVAKSACILQDLKVGTVGSETLFVDQSANEVNVANPSNPTGALNVGNTARSGTPTSGGVLSRFENVTFTDSATAASGTATDVHYNRFLTPTLAATNASVTTTTACTVSIQGAPTAGTNQTITNAYALCVDSGNVTMGGDLNVDGTLTTDTLEISGTGENCTMVAGHAFQVTPGGIGIEGESYFASDVCFAEDVSITLTLDVDGATTLDQTTINTTDGAFLVEGSGNITTTNTGSISVSGNSGIDIDSTGAITIDTTNTGTGVTIATATAGVPISIGNAVSEVTINDNLTVIGDLTVQGTTTTLDTQNLQVEDHNIEIGKVITPTDATANGGGITLKGATDKTITWVQSTGCWTFNQCIDAPSLVLSDTDEDCDSVAGNAFQLTTGGIGVAGDSHFAKSVCILNTVEVGTNGSESLIVSPTAITGNTTGATSFTADAASQFVTTTGNLTLTAAAIMDVNGATVDIDSTGALTMDSVTTTDITSGTAGSFTTTAGNLLLTAAAIMDVNGATVDIDSTGALTMDSVTTTDITSGTAGSFTTTTGNLVLTAAAIMDVNGATVDIDSTGALTMDSTTTMDINSGGIMSINTANNNDVNIGGTASSTVTINNDLVVADLLTVQGDNSVSGPQAGIAIAVPAFTVDDTSGTATATQDVNYFGVPTLTASAAITTTTACTVNIAGAPVAGTNQTITNSYALCVTDNSNFDGDVNVTGTLNVPSLNITGTADCDGAGGAALSTDGGLDVAKSACILENLNVGTVGDEVLIVNNTTETFTVSGSGAASITAGAASNFTTTAGDLTMTAAGELNLDGATVDINSTGAMTVDSTTLDIVATGILNINTGAGSNDSIKIGTSTSTVTMGNDVIIQDLLSVNGTTKDEPTGKFQHNIALGGGVNYPGTTPFATDAVFMNYGSVGHHGSFCQSMTSNTYRVDGSADWRVFDSSFSAGGIVSRLEMCKTGLAYITAGSSGNALTADQVLTSGEFTTRFTIDDDGLVGIGTNNPSAILMVGAPAASTDTTVMTSGAANRSGVSLRVDGLTYEDTATAGSGTATGPFSFNYIGQPTLAADNTSVTTTTACTFTIQGAPTAGSNQTITNSYALCVTDNSNFDGDVNVTGTMNITNTTDCTPTPASAAIYTAGGIASAKSICSGADLDVTDQTTTKRLSTTNSSQPKHLYVNSNAGVGEGIVGQEHAPYNTITAALAAASDGDTITLQTDIANEDIDLSTNFGAGGETLTIIVPDCTTWTSTSATTMIRRTTGTGVMTLNLIVDGKIEKTGNAITIDCSASGTKLDITCNITGSNRGIIDNTGADNKASLKDVTKIQHMEELKSTDEILRYEYVTAPLVEYVHLMTGVAGGTAADLVIGVATGIDLVMRHIGKMTVPAGGLAAIKSSADDMLGVVASDVRIISNSTTEQAVDVDRFTSMRNCQIKMKAGTLHAVFLGANADTTANPNFINCTLNATATECIDATAAAGMTIDAAMVLSNVTLRSANVAQGAAQSNNVSTAWADISEAA